MRVNGNGNCGLWLIAMCLQCLNAQLLPSCQTLDPMDCRARQAPLSMGELLSRQEHWSGLLCPPPGDLHDPGTEHMSPELEADTLIIEHSDVSVYLNQL